MKHINDSNVRRLLEGILHGHRRHSGDRTLLYGALLTEDYTEEDEGYSKHFRCVRCRNCDMMLEWEYGGHTSDDLKGHREGCPIADVEAFLGGRSKMTAIERAEALLAAANSEPGHDYWAVGAARDQIAVLASVPPFELLRGYIGAVKAITPDPWFAFGTSFQCVYCDRTWEKTEPLQHATDCPWVTTTADFENLFPEKEE